MRRRRCHRGLRRLLSWLRRLQRKLQQPEQRRHRARGGSVLLTSHHLHLDAEAASAGFRVLDLDLLPRDAGVPA